MTDESRAIAVGGAFILAALAVAFLGPWRWQWTLRRQQPALAMTSRDLACVLFIMLSGCTQPDRRPRHTPPPAAARGASPAVVVPELVPARTANRDVNLVAFSDVSRQRHLPRFEQLPSDAPFRGIPASVDLPSHERARRYRTVLSEGAREGPNFAGRYTLVHWGCGSPCSQLAIVGAPTGRILYMTPDSEAMVSAPMFRLDSRLLVVRPTSSHLASRHLEREDQSLRIGTSALGDSMVSRDRRSGSLAADASGAMDRRTFLAAATALASTLPQIADSSRRPATPSRTRLILLGTAGGPRPHVTRGAPAQVIIANDAAYVVDCGNGVARQLVAAGVALRSIRGVFVTHHHSDHNADYGTLLLLAWAAGLTAPVDTWGPPPLARITELFFEMSATDIDARMRDEGRPDPRPLVHAHEIRVGGRVTGDDNLTVTATVVEHPPLTPAFAFRFDAPDRSIVISGDTRRSDALVELARGADVLVHEALMASAVDRLVANVPNASDLERSILSHHTTAEDAGRVAQAAGVGTLVLSHLVPADDPSVSEEAWVEAAQRHFRGRVILGRDLLEI